MATSAARLVLGPLLRHVDESSAALWLEVSAPAVVEVDADGVTGSARTFAVHGHHYALVELEHLGAGTRRSYEVRLNGELVWPEPDSPFPPSVIVTPEADAPLAIAYGSCRTAVPNDAENHATHGVDAMRSYALRLSGLAAPQGSAEEAEELEHLVWPDLLLLLGDQVYADETSEAMQEFIASRRDLDEPPGEELKDYEEYAHLYSLAWSDPADRWLLSTVPSAMIFDDHDVRDDWNTSHTWRAQMESTPWWHGRIVAALSSYWVYQHLGNMSRDEREQDELWRAVRDHEGPEGPDLGELLDAFADRVDQEPDTYRWSYSRDFGTRSGSWSSTAGPPGCWTRGPGHAGPGRAGLARQPDPGRRGPPAGRHLAPVPALPRPAPRRGLLRGAGPGGVGPARGEGGGAAAAGGRPGALGGVPGDLPHGGRHGDRRRHRSPGPLHPRR